MSPKLHRDARGLHSSVLDVIYAWKDFQERGQTSVSSREDFIEARDDFHEELTSLQLDEELYRKLVR